VRLPNLFLIGAMKSGTTTLAAHLIRSPDVAFYAVKEPQIFNAGTHHAIRARLDALGPCDPDTRWILDATPNYTRAPDDGSAEAIKAMVSETPRFIYMMRDPVERVISHYFWNRERYGETLPFMEAIARDRRYIEPSLYDVQIKRYISLFDPAAFTWLSFEDFVRDPAATVARLLEGLGAAPAADIDLKKKGSSTNKVVTREARFPRLMTALRANRGLVEFAKLIIPARHIVPIMRRLTREIPRMEIAENEKAEVHERYFKGLAARTEALTGLDLSHWRR
jgi:hypothetical protein